MKKIIIFFFTSSFFISGCNPVKKRSSSSTPVESSRPIFPHEDNYEANSKEFYDEISDLDFEFLFNVLPGESLETTEIPHYESINNRENKNNLELLTTPTYEDYCQIPSKISELNSGSEFRLFKFNSRTQAKANLLGFSGDIGNKEILFIQDYIRYENLKCNEKEIKVGVGLRCFIHVSSLRGRIEFLNLPSLAAQVQLGRAKSTFNIKSLGFGIDGAIISDGLNNQGVYDVENFGKLSVIFNNVLTLLNNETELKIRAVELP